MNHITILSNAVISETQKTHDGWKPLYLFNIYRLTIATLFVSTFVTEIAPSFLGSHNPTLYLTVASFYCAFALLSEYMIRYHWLPFEVQVLGQVLIDIALLSLLMHSSGGIDSGLGVLLVVAIAGGSLLTEGRTAFFFAAVASLFVLVHVSMADIYQWFSRTSYTHAGMLGVTFFATAFLAHILAQRIRSSEALAQQRGAHLQYLSQLNEQIVQHIQSGIVAIDIVGRIRLFNKAAYGLLNCKDTPHGKTLYEMIPELADKVAKWRESGKSTPQLFRPAQGEIDLLATFTELSRAGEISILIVIEDATLTNQRAQQLKLASLGRLTASIAHEIRNPLSAISQASQLLQTSEDLTEDNKQLAKIITKHTFRVNSIIEQVLQLGRRQENDAEIFDLVSWLEDFIEDFIANYGLQPDDIHFYKYSNYIAVQFNRLQLYQVLNNLCENALRYSQGQPMIELSIKINPESKRSYLDVRDFGGGMNAETIRQVFEPFFTTEKSGTGLGLYLAREICEAYKASLHLAENSEKGCCFRIHFTELESETS